MSCHLMQYNCKTLFYSIWYKLKISVLTQWFRTLFFRSETGLLVTAFVEPSPWGILEHNFGDDINKPLLEELTGRKVTFVQQINYKGQINLSAIGSILGTISNSNSLIWGSGLISGSVPMMEPPKKVYAVRGPFTHKILKSYGFECPFVYGDPALLLPYIYKPSLKKKKYKFGIIPHVSDYELPHVALFRHDHPEILFIQFSHYRNWHNVIEQICSCEYIVSSSLHGLIVSDAYSIPNVFVQFSDLLMGGDFKFKDYMAGVNRRYVEPVDMRVSIELNSLQRLLESYSPINYDPKPLLKAFPYDLSPVFAKMI